MDEYIKREDALEAIKALHNICGCAAIDRDDAENAIMDCPTADVAPKSEVAREIFARVRKAFYDVSSVTHNELTKAIRDDDQYQIDLVSGIDHVLRAVRGIIEEFAKEYTKGGE